MHKKEEEKEYYDEYFTCPSFSTYSSDKLSHLTQDHLRSPNDNHFDLNDDNFEFLPFQKPSSVFPIFNHDIVTVSDRNGGDDGIGWNSGEEEDLVLMRKLLISDEDRSRESPSSSSSSEVDDLDGIPAGTYCVWTPKSAQSVQPSPNRCEKSNSTGSSSPAKRWKVLDLLRRSNSDVKNTFVFLKKKGEEKSDNLKERRGSRNNNEIAGVGERKLLATVSAHEALYVRNRENRIIENNWRRTYLPYKQCIIGFTATFNDIGRGFAPF